MEKLHAVAFFLTLTVTGSAFAVLAPRLPAPDRLDTEVDRYVGFPCLVAERDFNLRMEFTGTPSNDVEVVFGCDGDGDGRLDDHEAGLSVGWRCGKYFMENPLDGMIFCETNVSESGVSRILDWRLSLDSRRHPRRLEVRNECGEAFTNVPVRACAWLYDPDWDLVRVVAHGVDAQNETVSVERLANGIFFIFR